MFFIYNIKNDHNSSYDAKTQNKHTIHRIKTRHHVGDIKQIVSLNPAGSII